MAPDELLESERSGHDEGAFTGARRQGKPGKFELADTGTLFLDEIGDMIGIATLYRKNPGRSMNRSSDSLSK